MMAVPFPATAFKVAILSGGRVISSVNIASKLLADAVNSVPDSGFAMNPSQRRNALLNKIEALDAQLSAGAIQGAINMLRNDIRKSLQDCR
jgi:hypothetical protein